MHFCLFLFNFNLLFQTRFLVVTVLSTVAGDLLCRTWIVHLYPHKGILFPLCICCGRSLMYIGKTNNGPSMTIVQPKFHPAAEETVLRLNPFFRQYD
jgi:hypothetical protein